MSQRKFQGHTIAEAAIAACQALDIPRSHLKYKVISDEGNNLDRRIIIEVLNKNKKNVKTDKVDKTKSFSKQNDLPQKKNYYNDNKRFNKQHKKKSKDNDKKIENLLNLELIPNKIIDKKEITTGLSQEAIHAKTIVEEMINLLELQLTIHVVEQGNKEIHMDFRGKDIDKILSENDEKLFAFQFIVNRIINCNGTASDNKFIVLDVANYRKRRQDALSKLAIRLAEKSVETQKVVRMNPISSQDRRIFHTILKKMDSVYTRSEGDGVFRNILIIPSNYT